MIIDVHKQNVKPVESNFCPQLGQLVLMINQITSDFGIPYSILKNYCLEDIYMMYDESIRIKEIREFIRNNRYSGVINDNKHS